MPSRHALTADEQERLRKIIRRDGLVATAQSWGLSRETLARLAAGLAGHNGSVALARTNLEAGARA